MAARARVLSVGYDTTSTQSASRLAGEAVGISYGGIGWRGGALKRVYASTGAQRSPSRWWIPATVLVMVVLVSTPILGAPQVRHWLTGVLRQEAIRRPRRRGSSVNGWSRWALLASKEHGRVRDRGREALVGVVRADASLGDGRSVAGHLRRSGREAFVAVVKPTDFGQFDDLA